MQRHFSASTCLARNSCANSPPIWTSTTARPQFADLALFGPLSAHLHRDPASRAILERVAPNAARWTERIIAGQPPDDDLTGQDAAPDATFPLFRLHAAEHLPVLVATNAVFGKQAKTTLLGDEVAHSLGRVPFTKGGVQVQTQVAPFSLFRRQAALDALGALSERALAKATSILARINSENLLSFDIKHRLERGNCGLCLA